MPAQASGTGPGLLLRCHLHVLTETEHMTNGLPEKGPALLIVMTLTQTDPASVSIFSPIPAVLP